MSNSQSSTGGNVPNSPTPLASPVPKKELHVALASLVDGLLTLSNADEEQAFAVLAQSQPVQDAIDCLLVGDINGYIYKCPYPMGRGLRGLAVHYFPTNRLAQFVVERLEFVQGHVRQFFETHEGSACCGDKSTWVLAHFLRFARRGKPIEFDYAQKYTYQLPRKVLTSQEDILMFLQALSELYYGNVDRYLQVREALLAKAAEAAATLAATGSSTGDAPGVGANA